MSTAFIVGETKEQTRRRLNAEHMRKYRRENPEREHAARIRAAACLLQREGWTVFDESGQAFGTANKKDLEKRG